jgi:hypothetical protein
MAAALLISTNHGAAGNSLSFAGKHGEIVDADAAASLRAVGFDSALDLVNTFAGAHLNGNRAPKILRTIAAAPVFPDRLFVAAPAQLEELRQRLAAMRSQ